jgi:DNA uptake protein ComE-like DNA-binding protein
MAEREVGPVPTEHSAALRTTQSLAFLVGTGVCFALSLWFAVSVLRPAQDVAEPPTSERINPNEAPMASLMRLPQIGAARARAIVTHRERLRAQAGQPAAFQTADDLEQIKGIGPAIVEGVRPWLQFNDPLSDGNQPPER